MPLLLLEHSDLYGCEFRFEQIDFLKKLYRNELPFKVLHQRLVKDLIILQAEKTGYFEGKRVGMGVEVG